MSFERSCTKMELLNAIAMFERRIAGESEAKIAKSQGMTAAVLKARCAVVERLASIRMGNAAFSQWQSRPLATGRTNAYKPFQAAWAEAIKTLHAEVSPLSEVNPIQQLRDGASGDLSGLSSREINCLESHLGVHDKAGLVVAAKAGKVTSQSIPNLGQKSIKAILDFANN